MCTGSRWTNRRNFWGSENQLVLALIGELSLVLEGLEQFDEAIPLAEQRAALCSKHLGASHSDTLSALNDLGKALTMQGTNRDAARKALTTALQGRINLSGKSVLTAQTMINLGMLLCDNRELDEAREFLEEAASYLEDMDNSENLSLQLDSLGCLAWVSSQQGRQWEAFNLLQKAAYLAETHLGPDSTAAKVWNGQLAFHAADSLPLTDENTVKTIELTFDGLLSEQDSTFTRHIHPISIKRKLAEFYYLCGQTSKAKRLLEGVVKTIGDSSSKARNERALLLNLQGMLQWDCGLLHDAINLCDQSIATYGDDPDATNTVLNRAVVLRDLGELQEAEQIFNHHLLAQETTEHASLGYTNLASISSSRQVRRGHGTV